jgi:type II secretory pathway pseudopilin PulG
MKRKGFTLVEMVLILTVVFILAAIGAWKVAGLRDEANGVAQDDAP